MKTIESLEKLLVAIAAADLTATGIEIKYIPEEGKPTPFKVASTGLGTGSSASAPRLADALDQLAAQIVKRSELQLKRHQESAAAEERALGELKKTLRDL